MSEKGQAAIGGPARLYQLKGDWMHRESTWPKSWTEAEAELFTIYTVS